MHAKGGNCVAIFRVTTCLEKLENLEMSGNLKHVRDVVNSQGIVIEMPGKKILSWKCPRTVHY